MTEVRRVHLTVFSRDVHKKVFRCVVTVEVAGRSRHYFTLDLHRSDLRGLRKLTRREVQELAHEALVPSGPIQHVPLPDGRRSGVSTPWASPVVWVLEAYGRNGLLLAEWEIEALDEEWLRERLDTDEVVDMWRVSQAMLGELGAEFGVPVDIDGPAEYFIGARQRNDA